MEIVVSRPNDDDDIVDVYLVNHGDRKNVSKAFSEEWDVALEKAKKKDAETWMVDMVVEALERNGWQIIRITPVRVTY